MKKKWIASDIPRVLAVGSASEYNEKNRPCIEIPYGLARGSLQIVLVVISLVFIFSYVSAEDLKSITADELKKMLDKKTRLVLVDARPQEEFSQGHIPLSVNIPPDKVGSISKLLPKNKKIAVVFYCRGAG
jgi:hypothetical protein